MEEKSLQYHKSRTQKKGVGYPALCQKLQQIGTRKQSPVSLQKLIGVLLALHFFCSV